MTQDNLILYKNVAKNFRTLKNYIIINLTLFEIPDQLLKFSDIRYFY